VFLLSTCRPGDLWIQIDTRCRSLARSLSLSLLSPAHKHTHTRGAWQRQEYKSSVRTQGVGKNRPAIPIFHINFLLRSQPRQYFATRIYILERVYWTTARSNVECQTIFLTFISRAFCKLRVATRGKPRNYFNNFARAMFAVFWQIGGGGIIFILYLLIRCVSFEDFVLITSLQYRYPATAERWLKIVAHSRPS